MSLTLDVRSNHVLQLFSAFALVVIVGMSPVAFVASPPAAEDLPPDVSNLLLPSDASTGLIDAELLHATGTVQVVVQLTGAPLAVANGANAKQFGGRFSPTQQRQYIAGLSDKQNILMSQIRGLGGVELARLSKALDALIVSIDSSKLTALASFLNVKSIRPVSTYELDLSTTVTYIGGDTVHGLGFDGTGVRVAVLDSGIDYTHADLGGAGTAAAYTDAYGTTIDDARNKNTDGLFPTAKVVGGFDFLGERWPMGDPACGVDGGGNPLVCLQPDPDPIGCGPAAIPAPCDGGHGTHTSSIIGGVGGVAPGATLYAVKVCSAVATSCSGVALLQAMDFALDPDGDGSISDAVDVINMSLGSSYGQKEDDLSAASANAVRAGIMVVASAGNSADRPYIVGSPSTTPEVLSVAATMHPSALMYLIQTPTASSKGSIWQSWSVAPSLVSGTLVYDTASASTRRGCTNAAGGNPWAVNSHLNQVLLIDRGTCAVSRKVANAGVAGAVAAVIANNVAQAPGDLPPTFSFGGGTQTIAGYTITLADGDDLKTLALGQTATINPAVAVSLVKNMAAFSSRGPSYSNNAIKPDIGAPGTDIISAEAGSGTGRTPFAGTSASAPVVAGTAVLMVDAYPLRTPSEIKSMLMNTAETNIGLNPVGLPGVLAPVTRIGGGEVRVDQAINSKTAAWDSIDLTGSLSFGYQALQSSAQFMRTVVVRNYGSTVRTYSITPTFRYSSDAASGAVTISVPSSVTVQPGSVSTFKVKLGVDATKLPIWDLNGGNRGGDGFRLQGVEFDGYIGISDGTDNVHVAWQILPHRAATVSPASDTVTLSGGTGSVALSNAGGAVDGRVDVFSLLGLSGRIPPSTLPQAGDNFAVVDLKAVGARLVTAGGQPAVQFAINTFGIRSHPNYPAEFDIYIDTNRDGINDFVVFNRENGAFASTGQNVVAAGPLSGPFAIRFFSDADLDSGNIILTARLSDIGLTSSTQFNFSVLAGDNYFTGLVTDAIVGMTYTLNTPRFIGFGIPSTGVPAGGSSTLTINSVAGGDVASPSQTGLLLLYRDGLSVHERDLITVIDG